MLLETVYAEDVCVCMASLLQLSVLASCPEHRVWSFSWHMICLNIILNLKQVKFFKSKGGLDVFSHFSQRADLDACFPQRNSLQEAAPALSKFYQTVIGLPYEMTHPKVKFRLTFKGRTWLRRICSVFSQKESPRLQSTNHVHLIYQLVYLYCMIS